jgi:protoporphyrin/coproporphyrin ferrochelatase
MNIEYDSILIVGFGGPERAEDVIPFLQNVTRGRNTPRERLLEVAEHYYHFGGVSPINAQVRALIAALRTEMDQANLPLPLYWGNRNWHPMLDDTFAEMTAAGRRRSLAVVLAAYSSYSSCRQYREDIERARASAGQKAPLVDKVRAFYNHPTFIAANADRVREGLRAIATVSGESMAHLAFTAHSIPVSMARDCDYERQLVETCRLVAQAVGVEPGGWQLVYQSRSGRPEDPWLEPDVLDHLRGLKERGIHNVVIHPIGFLSDHMEVLFDLDEEARQLSDALGLNMVRSGTVGLHPGFISMLLELIRERIGAIPESDRQSAGQYGPSHDVCPETCCPPPIRHAARDERRVIPARSDARSSDGQIS